MNLQLRYKDPIILIDTAQDGYGDNTVNHVEHLRGLFLQGESQGQVGSVEAINTDAHVYLDLDNSFIRANAFRLEGMYIVANIFNGENNESWYKISRVKLGQRKLLANDLNNIHCFLTKCDALEYEES